MQSRTDVRQSASEALDSPANVLCVDDDPEYLDLVARQLSEYDDLAVTTESSPFDALQRLDGVADGWHGARRDETPGDAPDEASAEASSDADDATDGASDDATGGSTSDPAPEFDCVVSDYEMPSLDGLEFLSAVRERRPSLPFVLFTNSSRRDVVSSLPQSTWTEFLRKGNPGATTPLLVGRVRRLVDHHRTAAVARRAETALDVAREGLAVVDPDGSFESVNRVYARRFGFDRAELIGRDWRTCYPEREVERLESSALRTVRDDWQWTGGCAGRRRDGETFTAPTRIAGLDDGSFVLCVSEPADEE